MQEPIARLEHCEDKGDWDEPIFAAYLKKHIFDIEDGVIRAAWCCGIGAVPLGFTTYAPNAIESSHRVLKGLLDSAWLHRDIATLMVDVCESVSSRMVAGKFDDMRQVLPKAPAGLTSKGMSRSSSRLCWVDDFLKLYSTVFFFTVFNTLRFLFSALFHVGNQFSLI